MRIGLDGFEGVWPLVEKALADGRDVEIKITDRQDGKTGQVYVPIEWLKALWAAGVSATKAAEKT